MKSALRAFEAELEAIRAAGTWREERIITTPQRSRIDTTALRKALPEVAAAFTRQTTVRRFCVA